MTTSNHPENLNTNQAHDLGQISIEPPKRYVVVEYPGTYREFQVFAANTYRDCHLWMNRHYTDDHCPADIMVQLPDGTLSTEI